MDYTVPQKVLSHLYTNMCQCVYITIQDKNNIVLPTIIVLTTQGNSVAGHFQGISSGYGAGLTFADSNALTVCSEVSELHIFLFHWGEDCV